MDQLVPFVAHAYGLPSLRYVAPVEQGFLSQNHILEADKQQYFLKRYRFTTQDPNAQQKVATIHRAKFHFAANSIPAILPLKSNAGETFFGGCFSASTDASSTENIDAGDGANDLRFYALFPFVDGSKSKRGAMSQATLNSAGETLGRLHRAGHNVLDIAPLAGKATFDPAPFWEKSAFMLKIIESKANKTEFDELAEETLQRKRTLALTHPPTFHELGLTDNHLVHGDYQNDNFFIDNDGIVSHVFDWELTKVTAREVALLRSVLFICLQTEEDYGLRVNEETLLQAKHYLASYHDAYPLERSLLAAAIESRQLGNIYSTWVEEEHYLKGNDRVDLFLPGALESLNYLAQHRAELTDQLWSLI